MMREEGLEVKLNGVAVLHVSVLRQVGHVILAQRVLGRRVNDNLIDGDLRCQVDI